MSAIIIKEVTKEFTLYKESSNTLKEFVIRRITGKFKGEKTKVTVLKDVSLKIEKGEMVGIIGENGTGKSTLLKIVASILKPNKGEVNVKGTLAALLEIGLGFHPDLTGRNNAYLYGSILGISRKSMSMLLEEIIEFSELMDYIDVPIRNYSSGMQMRLAFAVAVCVDPDILLLDEVFAVGDERFQKKSFERINRFREQGKTIVLVSHDMNIMKNLCHKLIYLRKDGSIEIGSPDEMIALYRSGNINTNLQELIV